VPTDISLSSVSINENVPGNSTVGTLSTADPNSVDVFTYTLVSGAGDADNSSFNINGSDLRIANSPDFETKSSYSIRIRTTDQGGLMFEESFTITINDLSEAVIPTLSTNAATSVTVTSATLGGNVTNDGGASVTERGVVYSTVAMPTTADTKVQIGTGIGIFSQSVAGLTTSTTYFVRAYAINASGTAYGSQVSFTTTAIVGNNAPTDITLSNAAVDEHVPENTLIATIGSSDQDVGNAFTYTLVSGTGDTDNASFHIDGDNLFIVNSPDFETQNSYTIRIKTADQGGLFFEKSFVITINDLNEGIPNALFPNGSEQNKTWGISHLGLQEKVKINVLDSNGHVVFSTDDPQQEWNGTSHGKQVPEDVYFYSITLSNGNQFQGSLHVIY
jgi:gliding motility-associated-like protein